MSVEQTSQLIQLILNSVLMVVVGGLVLMGLMAHQGVIYQRLQWVNREYREQLMGAVPLERDRFSWLKTHQRDLRHHYHQIQTSVFLAYGALVLLLGSSFLLGIRTLVNLGWLIPGSMVLFVGGNAVLLAGVGLALLEVQRSRKSILSELRDWMRWGGLPASDPIPESGRLRSRPIRPTRLLPAKRIKAG